MPRDFCFSGAAFVLFSGLVSRGCGFGVVGLGVAGLVVVDSEGVDWLLSRGCGFGGLDSVLLDSVAWIGYCGFGVVSL